jgi:hypothetical protein
MKKYIKLLIVFLLLPFIAFTQEDETKKEEVKEKLERPAFESSFIIDNPTNVVFSKKSLEVTMSHRFGTFNGGTNDLVGFWAPSNIRIAVSYALLERLTIGYGTTKFDRLQDFNWKYALLRQTRSNSMPVSVTYYGNFVVDARKPDGRFFVIQDRYSFFNQLIIAKRFSPNVSLQIAPSISHYNRITDNILDHDMFGLAFGGRIKVSPQTSLMFDYSQPLTDIEGMDIEPGFSFGLEFATSAHAFQLFATNLNGIVPQKNYMTNTNKDLLIGFNITRVYNF